MEELDFAVLDFIYNTFRCGFLDAVFPFITALGNSGIIWIAAGAALLGFPKYRRRGLYLLCALLAGLLVGNLFLKLTVARPRPCWINDSVELLISMPRDYSFPSGHALSSFAGASVLAGTRRSWGYFAFALASLIAFSRLYLYVHFPTDVLAGAAIGLVLGFCVPKLLELLEQRVKASKPRA